MLLYQIYDLRNLKQSRGSYYFNKLSKQAFSHENCNFSSLFIQGVTKVLAGFITFLYIKVLDTTVHYHLFIQSLDLSITNFMRFGIPSIRFSRMFGGIVFHAIFKFSIRPCIVVT